MKCPYCGAKLASGARSCEKCGNYLGESFGGESTPSKNVAHTKSAKSSRMIVMALIIGLVILGVAVAAFLIYWR